MSATGFAWSALEMATVKWKAEQARRERRERIATAILAGLVTRAQFPSEAAAAAVTYADALIAKLDKPEEDKT